MFGTENRWDLKSSPVLISNDLNEETLLYNHIIMLSLYS